MVKSIDTVIQYYLVRLPAFENRGGRGTHSEPRLPILFYILDLKHSEKLGVTFRAHSFLFRKSEESIEKSSFFGKIQKFVFAHGAG